MKILIIEDDPASLKLASIVLQMSGHVIMLAATADQAFLSIKTVKPDAILMDLRLPGIEGWGIVRQCRKEPATRDIPIIAVTAYPNEYAQDEAIKAGCDAYILKPIDIHSLSQQIEDAVAAKKNQAKP